MADNKALPTDRPVTHKVSASLSVPVEASVQTARTAPFSASTQISSAAGAARGEAFANGVGAQRNAELLKVTEELRAALETARELATALDNARAGIGHNRPPETYASESTLPALSNSAIDDGMLALNIIRDAAANDYVRPSDQLSLATRTIERVAALVMAALAWLNDQGFAQTVLAGLVVANWHDLSSDLEELLAYLLKLLGVV